MIKKKTSPHPTPSNTNGNDTAHTEIGEEGEAFHWPKIEEKGGEEERRRTEEGVIWRIPLGRGEKEGGENEEK